MGPSVHCISEYNLNLLANGLSGVVCNQEMHNQYLKWQIRLPTAYSWCFAEIFYHLLVFNFTSRSPVKGAKKSISPYSYLALKYLMFCKPHKLLASASIHSSFQVYDMYFMKQSGVCPNFYKGKGAWPILSVTSCFWPLPITQYFHKYHTLGAFCHKTSRKTNIFMGDVRQRIMSWLTRAGSEWSMWVKWWR